MPERYVKPISLKEINELGGACSSISLAMAASILLDKPHLETSLAVMQSLLDKTHAEFDPSTMSGLKTWEIIYGNLIKNGAFNINFFQEFNIYETLDWLNHSLNLRGLSLEVEAMWLNSNKVFSVESPSYYIFPLLSELETSVFLMPLKVSVIGEDTKPAGHTIMVLPPDFSDPDNPSILIYDVNAEKVEQISWESFDYFFDQTDGFTPSYEEKWRMKIALSEPVLIIRRQPD